MRTIFTPIIALTLMATPLASGFAADAPAGDGALRAQAGQLHQEGDALRAKQAELKQEWQAHHQRAEALRSEAQAKRQANLAERKTKLEQRLSDVNSKMTAPVMAPTTPVK